MERALSLLVFYSNKYCANCKRQEEVLNEVHERYRNHIR